MGAYQCCPAFWSNIGCGLRILQLIFDGFFLSKTIFVAAFCGFAMSLTTGQAWIHFLFLPDFAGLLLLAMSHSIQLLYQTKTGRGLEWVTEIES